MPQRAGFLGEKGHVLNEAGQATARMIRRLEQKAIDLDAMVNQIRNDALTRIRATASISVRKDSGSVDVGTEPRLNFVAGTGITQAVVDVPADYEVKVTSAINTAVVPTWSASQTNTFARWLDSSGTLSDSTLYYDPTSDSGLGRVGIRTTAPAAILHVIGTTGNQLRLGHDTSNYADITLSSAGAVTLNATGASASWIFSDETVHNAGVDVGTSGRFDSNVADGAAASSFLFRPTVAQTSGTDRYIFRVDESSGNARVVVKADGTVEFFGSATTGGLICVNPSSTPTGVVGGILFQPQISGAGATVLGVSNTAYGGQFNCRAASGATTQMAVGGYFLAKPRTSATTTGAWAGWFQGNAGIAVGDAANVTEIGGWKVYGVRSTAKNIGTITNWYGGYVENSNNGSFSGTGAGLTNGYGLYLEEQTRAATINNEVFIAGAGGVWFRDQQLYIESTSDGHLDLYADTSIDMNGDVDMSTVDLITDTTTGTKIATGNTQKLGFWSATPIVQPTTAVAAATFTANTSGIVDDSATFDGYTIGQVVKALRNTGLLA